MKYIVMECHFSYAVLLDENGKFLKAANRGYQVGQTVCDPTLVGDYRYRPPLWRIFARAVMLLLLIAAVFFGIRYCDYTRSEANRNNGASSDSASTVISTDRAKEIALTHAGLAADTVTFIGIELDEEDGASVYELDFVAGGMEYEYEIDAISGNILQFQSEPHQ